MCTNIEPLREELPERLPRGGVGSGDMGKETEVLSNIEENTSFGRQGVRGRLGRSFWRHRLMVLIEHKVVRRTSAVVSASSCDNEQLGLGAFDIGGAGCGTPKVWNVGLICRVSKDVAKGLTGYTQFELQAVQGECSGRGF